MTTKRLTVNDLKNYQKGQELPLNVRNLRLCVKSDGSCVLQYYGLVSTKAVSQSDDVFAAANENKYDWVDLPVVVETA
jgi:hypothetical protein